MKTKFLINMGAALAMGVASFAATTAPASAQYYRGGYDRGDYYRGGYDRGYRGYRDGYYSRYQYGRYDNGIAAILPTILSAILNVSRY